MNFLTRNKYLATVIGFCLFTVLLIILSKINKHLAEVFKVSFEMYKIIFYQTCIQLIFYPLMFASLGLAKIIRAKCFDWKLFTIFVVIGMFAMFGGLILNFPMNPTIKLFLLQDLRSWGGIIIGIGILVAAKTNYE
ncbi:MAG: hypothetical protein FH756_15820 [Firmicutes bacterium]|nr:hypothetical protein [Bacillota bacterium]